jgi:glycosyltransferase involved in cell wall biosynthesis
MRVIHIITRLILGGAQENTLANADDLIRLHGDDVLLVTGPPEGPEGDLLDQACRRGVPVTIVNELQRAISPAKDWAAYRSLSRTIDAFRPDVVHTHSAKAGILGRAAASRRQTPAIIHTIHGLSFHSYEAWWKNRLYIAAEQRAARLCHKIISVADAMTEKSLAAGIGRPAQYVTIYSGMNVDEFLHPPKPREDMRRELGIAADRLVVMKIARLFELKGHDDVLDAAPAVVARYPNVLFVFVGGGVWRERLESRVRSLGLERHVHFTGLVAPDQIPSLLSASDLVVHASYREGLARVLPQALITGRPVVSYDIDGAREVVLPGQTGWLVKPGETEALGEAMMVALSDDTMRQRLGQRGRELFADTFRHETMTARIRYVYRDVLERRQPMR